MRIVIRFLWRGFNTTTIRYSAQYPILFGGVFHVILHYIVTTEPSLVPVYLRKLDLLDAYMRLWVFLEYVPSVTFLVPKRAKTETKSVVFHISIPMGFNESSPFFCMTIETSLYLSNNTIHAHRA